MDRRTRSRLVFVLGFLAYFGSIWLLWDTPVVYPLKIFVVLLHEISHGAAAVATGGRIDAIVLNPAQGGACRCPGGSPFWTLSAGYLGSLAWGVVLLLAAGWRRIRARALVGGVGAVILALTVLYLQGGFAVAFGVLFGLGLAASARWLGEGLNRTLVRVLGMTSCLYVVLDIKSDVLDRPHLPSDAAVLAELTGVPTLLWGLIWLAVAGGAIGWLLRRSWRRA